MRAKKGNSPVISFLDGLPTGRPLRAGRPARYFQAVAMMPAKPIPQVPPDAQQSETTGVRAKALDGQKADRAARIRAAGEQFAREHDEILQALAR